MDIKDKRKKVICDLVADELYVPMKEKELAMFLQVSKQDREELKKILEELLAEGKISLTQKGKYIKSAGKFFTGTFISNAKGFGFVEVEGREEDFYIPEHPLITHNSDTPWFPAYIGINDLYTIKALEVL